MSRKKKASVEEQPNSSSENSPRGGQELIQKILRMLGFGMLFLGTFFVLFNIFSTETRIPSWANYTGLGQTQALTIMDNYVFTYDSTLSNSDRMVGTYASSSISSQLMVYFDRKNINLGDYKIAFYFYNTESTYSITTYDENVDGDSIYMVVIPALVNKFKVVLFDKDEVELIYSPLIVKLESSELDIRNNYVFNLTSIDLGTKKLEGDYEEITFEGAKPKLFFVPSSYQMTKRKLAFFFFNETEESKGVFIKGVLSEGRYSVEIVEGFSLVQIVIFEQGLGYEKINEPIVQVFSVITDLFTIKTMWILAVLVFVGFFLVIWTTKQSILGKFLSSLIVGGFSVFGLLGVVGSFPTHYIYKFMNTPAFIQPLVDKIQNPHFLLGSGPILITASGLVFFLLFFSIGRKKKLWVRIIKLSIKISIISFILMAFGNAIMSIPFLEKINIGVFLPSLIFYVSVGAYALIPIASVIGFLDI